MAWFSSSHTHLPMIATGTVAGAMDASFSNDADLELFTVDLDSPELELQPSAKISCTSRFNRLAWSPHGGDAGVIAGGMEGGELNIWNTKSLLDGSSDALIFKNSQHSGSIFIWDLTNPSKPYSPGAKSQKVDAITSLSWNNQVQHILATSSNTGYTVVWDLRNRREVVALAHAGNVMPSSRGGISSIAWSPDVATQIVTASEDDSNPVIALWDLRNAHAPVKTLTGHQQGILSLSWCQKDSDLLLSAGKDSRTLCWNPRSGEIIGELPVSHNWTFEVEWYQRNPEFFASASFDGKITINSLQGSGREHSASGFEQESVSNDPFAPAAFAPQQSDGLNLKHPPKWLRRPVGATFAYGGKLTTFNNAAALKSANTDQQAAAVTPRNVSHTVKIRTIALDKELNDRVAQLLAAIENNGLAEYAQQHVSGDSWTILQALMKENVREHLVRDLGFDKDDVIAQISQAVANLKVAGGADVVENVEVEVKPVQETPTEESAQVEATEEAVLPEPTKAEEGQDEMTGLFASSSGEEPDFLAGATQPPAAAEPQPVEETVQTALAKPFKLYPEGSTDVDSLITRSLVLGDFESAVNMCVTVDRWADAFMFAVCGGEELLNRTRKTYFDRQIEKTPYLRLVQGIINHDLQDIVVNASLEDWREVMVVLCTFAKVEEFESLCETLGQRLEQQSHDQIQNAQLCYLAAGKLHKVVGIWIADQEADQSKPAALSLHDLMEKVTVYRNAINFVDNDMDAQPGQTFRLSALYDKYCDYARLLATEGNLTAALYFIDLIPQAYRSEKEDILSVTRDRLHHADGNDTRSGPVPFPFDTLPIAGFKAQQQQQPLAQQQLQQPSAYGSAYTPVQQQQQQANRYDKPLPSATSAVPNAYQGYTPSQPVQQQQQNPYARPTQPVAPSIPQPGVQNQPYKPAAPTGYMPSQPGHSHTSSYGSNQGSYGASYNPYQAPTAQAPLPPPPTNTESVAAYRKDITAWNDPPIVSRTPGGSVKSPGTPTSAPQRITSPFPNAGPMTHAPMGGPMANGPPSHAAAPLPPPPTGGIAPMPLYRSGSPATGYRPNSPSMTQRGPYAGAPPMHPGQQHQPPPQQQQGPPSGGRGSFSYAPPAGHVNTPGPMAPPPSHMQPSPAQQQQQQQQQPPAPAPAPAPAPPQPKRHPKGDQTHIPPAQKMIVATLTAELQRARQNSGPAQKRMWDDAEKRLVVMSDMLNNHELSSEVTDRMIALAQAIQQRNYEDAGRIQLELATTKSDECGTWWVGVKRIIEFDKTLP
ncbi:protein transport protein S31 [Umbelopsis nana]